MQTTNTVSEVKKTQPSVESFDKIVNESTASLNAETSAQIRRGRGRPKGSPNVKGRDPVNSTVNTSTNAENVTPTLEAGQAQAALPALDLQPILKDVTKLPFSVAAIKYKMPELEISDAEAETPTFYLNRVLNYYMPDIERKNPKAFAISAWVLSLVLVGIKKVVAIVELKKNNLITVNQSGAQSEQKSDLDQFVPVPVRATTGTDASSLFGGRI